MRLSRLAPDRRLRTKHSGRILIGGTPRRVLRLSESGSRVARAWLTTSIPEPSTAAISLRARLVDSGMAHPVRAAEQDPTDVLPFIVVIPVKDDDEGLSATLTGLSMVPTVIVDDGSRAPVLPGSRPTVRVVRHRSARGPAAARNAGVRALADWQLAAGSATHPRPPTDGLLAFVDAGVEVNDSDLRRLAAHFLDAAVVAAAPRVRSAPGPSVLDRYEEHFSPLDLGPDPSPVGPDRGLTYLPSACLMVRASAFERVGGFNEQFRYGEDVDLIWRLEREGTIRYDPSVEVRHQPRRTWRAFIEQRFSYGTAAGQLATDHGARVAPWRTSIHSAGVVALALAGHTMLATAAGAYPVNHLRKQLEPIGDATVEATLLAAEGHAWALRSFAENLGRSWWPLTLVALILGPRRRSLLIWAMAGWARRLATTRSPTQLLVGVLDDLSYGTGVTVGAVRHRSWRTLAPVINRRS